MSETSDALRPSDPTSNGLPAPSSRGGFSKVVRWLRFIFLVPLARLRFIFILAAIGFIIVKWNYLAAQYEKLTPWKDSAATSGDTEFFCPMHQYIVRDNNKEKCPICGMPLSKRAKGPASDDPLPPGTVSRVQLSPYRIVQANVKTIAVAYQPLTKEINTIGTVEFDERGMKRISARVKGWIDTLIVNQTGEIVDPRTELASLYSPELVVTVDNLLIARKAKDTELEQNAIEKLKRLRIDKEEIDKIVADGKPVTHLIVRSPIKGHVLKRYISEGQFVEEGNPLYDIADLSTVWVVARLYEEDLAFLPKGTHDAKTGLVERKLKMTATSRAFPGRVFEGALSFVYPHLDPESRTLAVRFELANKDHELRPAETASVQMKLETKDFLDLPAGRGLNVKDGKVLALPERSIIDTGDHKIVYREAVPGTYEGVEVVLGARLTGPNGEAFYPVLAGIEEGEVVAASGSFLIDAEARLNPALGSIYVGGSSKGGTSPVRPSTPEDLNAKLYAAVNRLPSADRPLALAQRYCPVQDGTMLGSMGPIQKVFVDGKPVFLCCPICITEATENSTQTLGRLALLHKGADGPLTEEERKMRQRYEQLSLDDRKLVDQQRMCPVTEVPLLSMEVPIKLMVKGQPVFICCKGCKPDVEKTPDAVLKKVGEFKSRKFEPNK
jgi:Cu(I)/Ag(I) efflux system membrane fusion protein